VKQRGLTLIETLCAIAILAALAGVLLPVFAKAKASAKRTECMTRLSQVAVAIKAWQIDHDALPPSLEEVAKASKDQKKLAYCPLRETPYFYVLTRADTKWLEEHDPKNLISLEFKRWLSSYSRWLMSNQDLLEKAPIVYCMEAEHAQGGEVQYVNGTEQLVVTTPGGIRRPAVTLSGRVYFAPQRSELTDALRRFAKEHPEPR
jgi:prepilin-type N-terminal cleavage/methylation domain-containing protein